MAGPVRALARRCATRPPPHCTAPATAGGRGCWIRNGPTSTTSGKAQTSRSRATPNPNRRSDSGCFTCCRPAPAPNAGRSRPRGSPEPATTATPSGTPRLTCCRCSPTPRRMPSPTRCGGERRPGPRQGPGGRTRPQGRQLSVANHPRTGVLGVLAGRHGGLARQRRRRHGLRAVPHRHRRPRAGGRVRPQCADRDRPAVDLARTP